MPTEQDLRVADLLVQLDKHRECQQGKILPAFGNLMRTVEKSLQNYTSTERVQTPVRAAAADISLPDISIPTEHQKHQKQRDSAHVPTATEEYDHAVYNNPTTTPVVSPERPIVVETFATNGNENINNELHVQSSTPTASFLPSLDLNRDSHGMTTGPNKWRKTCVNDTKTKETTDVTVKTRSDWTQVKNLVEASTYFRYEHRRSTGRRNLPPCESLRSLLELSPFENQSPEDSIDAVLEANRPRQSKLSCSPPLVRLRNRRRSMPLCRICFEAGGHKPWCQFWDDHVTEANLHKDNTGVSIKDLYNDEKIEMDDIIESRNSRHTAKSTTVTKGEKENADVTIRKDTSDIYRIAYSRALADARARFNQFTDQTTRAFVFSYFSDSDRKKTRRPSGMKHIFGKFRPDRYYKSLCKEK